jgi:hypothetical protein
VFIIFIVKKLISMTEDILKIQDEIDYQFILRVQNEVTQSCALPFALPAERIPEYILQAAQYFWQNDDFSVEERHYFVKNEDICKTSKLNKIVQLPQQIVGVHGVYKVQSQLKYGAMGDFSIERMMLSSYSMFGGAGTIGGSTGGGMSISGTGYSLSDVVVSMYEVDTFNQMLNAPLTYNYNAFSSKLVLLGDLGSSDLLLATMQRCKIQDLYNNYYFFRYVVCLCKRALSTIYGMFEFNLPGGISINYSNLSDQASDEMDKIDEWIQNNRAIDYFFMPNTL